MTFTLTERTLYRPLSNFLSSIGCDSVEEVRLGGYPDLLVRLDGAQLVIQVKIGEEGLVDGITEVERHAREAGTNQKMLLVYPERVRVIFAKPDEARVKNIAMSVPLIHGIVLTDSLTENFQGSSAAFVLSRAVKAIKEEAKIYNPKITIDTLNESVQLLANELRRWNKVARLENEVVGRMELFTALGSDGQIREREFKVAAIDLSAYILVNQLLFYRIFSERTHKIPSLEDFKDKKDLARRFEQLLKIDFVPVFRVNILRLLPERAVINHFVKQVVNVIAALRPEKMEHDLMGRIFHDLLPHETRKLLAAFYTRPVAAELLSGLAITKSHDKVIDPACGSGTLLVSAYWQKRRLARPRENNLHKKFLEKEITGVDIMPFASHLTAVNLAAQDVEKITNNLRVGCEDSLTLKAGSLLSTADWQLNWLESDTQPAKVNVVESDTESRFDIGTVNVILMNPPFTKQERLPSDYHDEVLRRWGNLAGGRVGLWGPFIFLANEILKKGGRIGVVIPINVLRGEETRSIREFLLSGKYTWRYILRSTKNYGFSESSEYSDIILIVEKNTPKSSDRVGVILVQKDLKDFTLQEARMVADRIRTIKPGVTRKEELFEIYWEKHSWLDQHIENMMPLVSIGSIKNKKILSSFIDSVTSSPKTANFKQEQFSEGFRPVPAGLSDLVFITRPEPSQRAMYANIVLEKDTNNWVKGVSKTGIKVAVSEKYLLRSLRTPVGLDKMDISGNLDYLIIAPYKELGELKTLSSFQGDVNWAEIRNTAERTKTRLTICRRINPYSPSQKHMAFYSETPYYPSNQMEVVHAGGDEAKIMCLFFNSTAFMAQFLTNKEESTGRRVDIRVSDLVSMRGLDINSLKTEDKKLLLQTFGKVSRAEFPPIMEQYKTGFPLRRQIDESVLLVLGIKEKTINKTLPGLYETIYEEMMRMWSLRRD